MMEKTFAIIKPEAIERKIVGNIISEIEGAGLAISRMRMIQVPREMAEKHYAKDDAWYEKQGVRALEKYAQKGLDPLVEMGTDDPIQIGRNILEFVIKGLSAAPVIIMELAGENAAEVYRALCGTTEPANADPNSIRGKYGQGDTYEQADKEKRPVRTLVHGSGNAEEAAAELALWNDFF